MRSREGPLRFHDIIISESAVLVNTGPVYAAVAQLDRVPDSDSGGRGFESRQPYHVKTRPQGHVAAQAPPHRPATLFFLFRRDPLKLGSRLIEEPVRILIAPVQQKWAVKNRLPL